MDRELIERLARAAEFSEHNTWNGSVLWVGLQGDIERFAALIAEECAKVCEGVRDSSYGGAGDGADSCAYAIREKFSV